MRKFVVVRLFGMFAVMMLAPLIATSADAQDNTAPRLPPSPQPVPSPSGPFGGIAVENYLVTSSANERGSYLWIVAPAQHIVILCEKPEPAKDFSCLTKRLP